MSENYFLYIENETDGEKKRYRRDKKPYIDDERYKDRYKENLCILRNEEKQKGIENERRQNSERNERKVDDRCERKIKEIEER